MSAKEALKHPWLKIEKNSPISKKKSKIMDDTKQVGQRRREDQCDGVKVIQNEESPERQEQIQTKKMPLKML